MHFNENDKTRSAWGYEPHNILVFHNWNFLTHKNTPLWINVTCKIWSQFLSEIKIEISTPKRKPSSFLTLVQTWSTELKKQRYWLPSDGYGKWNGDWWQSVKFLAIFLWFLFAKFCMARVNASYLIQPILATYVLSAYKGYYMVSTSFI